MYYAYTSFQRRMTRRRVVLRRRSSDVLPAMAACQTSQPYSLHSTAYVFINRELCQRRPSTIRTHGPAFCRRHAFRAFPAYPWKDYFQMPSSFQSSSFPPFSSSLLCSADYLENVSRDCEPANFSEDFVARRECCFNLSLNFFSGINEWNF